MDIASLFSTPSTPAGNATASNLLAGDGGAAVVNAESAENFNRLLMSFLDQTSKDKDNGGSKTQSSMDRAASLFGDSAKQNLVSASTVTSAGTSTDTGSVDETALAAGFSQLPRQVRAAVPDMRWQQAGLNLLAMNQADGTPPPLSDEVTSFLNDLSALMRQQGMLSGKGITATGSGNEAAGAENAKGEAVEIAADAGGNATLVASTMVTGVAAADTTQPSLVTPTIGTSTGSNDAATVAVAMNGGTDTATIQVAPAVVQTQPRGLKAPSGTPGFETVKSEASDKEAVAPAMAAAPGKTETVASTGEVTSGIGSVIPTKTAPQGKTETVTSIGTMAPGIGSVKPTKATPEGKTEAIANTGTMAPGIMSATPTATAPEGKTVTVASTGTITSAQAGNPATTQPTADGTGGNTDDAAQIITPAAIITPPSGPNVVAAATTETMTTEAVLGTGAGVSSASAGTTAGPSATHVQANMTGQSAAIASTPPQPESRQQMATAPGPRENGAGNTGTIALPVGMAPAAPGDKLSAPAMVNQPVHQPASAITAAAPTSTPDAAASATGNVQRMQAPSPVINASSTVAPEAGGATVKSATPVMAAAVTSAGGTETAPTGNKPDPAASTGETTASASPDTSAVIPTTKAEKAEAVPTATASTPAAATAKSPENPMNAPTSPPSGGKAEQHLANHGARHVAKGHDKHSQQPLNGMAKNDSKLQAEATKGENEAPLTGTDQTMETGETDTAEVTGDTAQLSADMDAAKNIGTDDAGITKKVEQPQVITPAMVETVPATSVAALDRETAITGEVKDAKGMAAPLAGAVGDKPVATGNRPQAAPAAPSGSAADAAADADPAANGDADAASKETGKEGGKSHRMLAPQHTDPENAARTVADQAGERPQAPARPTNGNIGSPANNAAQDSLLTRAVSASDGAGSSELGSESHSGETATLAAQDSSASLAADGGKTGTTDFTQHLRQASAPASNHRPGATPTATYQVALQVQRATQDGNDKISIQLRPYDLGRVDVQLEFNNEGKLRAKVTADSIQTLELLQKDSRNLERALQEAGLSTDQSSLSFSLRDDNDQAQRQQQDNQQEKKSGTRLANIEVEEEIPAVPAYRPVIGPGRVDVRI